MIYAFRKAVNKDFLVVQLPAASARAGQGAGNDAKRACRKDVRYRQGCFKVGERPFISDIASLPKLAEILGVSVDELMHANNRATTAQASAEANAAQAGNAHNIEEKEEKAASAISRIADTALKAVALAMGVAVAVLSLMQQVEADAAIRMLGLGLAYIAVAGLKRN